MNSGGLIVAEIFENHIYGTEDYIPTLKTALEVVGLDLKEKKNTNLSAQYFGFVAVKENGKIIIKKVEPNSIADKNEIGVEDEISQINEKDIKNKLSESLKKIKNTATLTIKKKFSEKKITLNFGNHYKILEFKKERNATENQLIFRKIWLS